MGAFFLFGNLHAQHFIGAQGGIHASNMNISGLSDFLPDAETIWRGHGGLVYQYALTDNWRLNSGLGYSQRGFSAKASMNVELFGLDVPLGVTAITEADYIEAPVSLQYHFGQSTVRPYLELGLVPAYAVEARIREKANFLVDINIGEQKLPLESDLYNRWELGGLVGAGLAAKAPGGEFNLKAYYLGGMTDLFADPIIDVRMWNKSFGISAGYLIRI